MKKNKLGVYLLVLVILGLVIASFFTSNTIADPENYQCDSYSTIFSLLPPVIAIGLALITKEVYTSLLA